jgi:RimJ/RimL family protein N-acetyltransferase
MDKPRAESGTLTLLDGAGIVFRPIRATDREALQRFHSRQSDRSIYFRFFRALRVLGDQQARSFTELDNVTRFALVALDPANPTEIIGVVRFDREPGTSKAEYAAIVDDAWHGRGLGTQLTRRLIDGARARGITALFAYVMPANVQMLQLLRDFGLPEIVRFEGNVERVELDIRDGCAPEVESPPLGLQP